MKKLLKILFVIISFIWLAKAGVISLKDACLPKSIHIKVTTQSGKSIVDKTINNPRDGDKVNFSFIPNSSLNYTIESFPPNSICSFKGASGSKLPTNPDIECNCIQNIDNNNSKINIKPGKWLLTSRWKFEKPVPIVPPTPTETLCVKDPYKIFSVDKLAEIQDKECPIIMKKESFTYGEWKRLGSNNCDIHGTVKYLGDKLKEKIYYKSHSPTHPSSTIYIDGKRIGDCDK